VNQHRLRREVPGRPGGHAGEAGERAPAFAGESDVDELEFLVPPRPEGMRVRRPDQDQVPGAEVLALARGLLPAAAADDVEDLVEVRVRVEQGSPG